MGKHIILSVNDNKCARINFSLNKQNVGVNLKRSKAIEMLELLL